MKTRKMFWGIIAYGIVGVLGLASTALAAKPSPPCNPDGMLEPGEGCDPQGLVFRDGATCESEGFTGGTLACTATCQVDESGCVCAVFPGDGAGHGPPLRYTNNGDGTATDNNTLFMWEVKDNTGGIHDVNNTYTWSSTGSAADGTLFTDFLNKLNNTCDGAGATDCTVTGDAGCGTEKCGLAGHRDWRIPNVKELQSIVDYGRFGPAVGLNFPGLTAASFYWSSTSNAAFGPDFGWVVYFYDGGVFYAGRGDNHRGRAVRGGS